MKKTIVLILLAFLSHPGYSQSAVPYAGLFTGVSIPVGKFAAKNLDGGSFAKTGWKVGAEGASDYDLGLYFTAGALLSYRLCECLDLQAHANYSYGFLQYQFLTGTGAIREEDHQLMCIDAMVGFAFNF
jgi:hypothetical protein